MFSKPKRIPLKWDIQHEIQLLLNLLLSSIGLYHELVLNQEDIQNQIKNIVNQDVIRPSTSPFRSPFFLLPNMDDSWRR